MRQVSPYCRYYIQAARARKELSQAKLAKQVEADVMTISRAERGLTHPRPLLCARLARSLGVSESALLALAGWLGAPVDWFDHCTSNVEMQAKGGQVLESWTTLAPKNAKPFAMQLSSAFCWGMAPRILTNLYSVQEPPLAFRLVWMLPTSPCSHAFATGLSRSRLIGGV